MTSMADAAHRRWFRLTPGHLLVVLLAAEGMLWLSERFRWFPFNQHKGWTVLIAIASVGVFLVLMFLWFLAALVFRWRFQFSILSLLVLVVAVALPFAWLETEMKAAREQGKVAASIKKMQRPIYYDYDFNYDKRENPFLLRKFSEPKSPRRLGNALGGDFFATMTAVNLNWAAASNADVERLRGVTGLTSLQLAGGRYDDSALECLEGMKQLEELCIRSSYNITDAGLKHLEGLTQLKRLDLFWNCRIGDRGLEHLKGLSQLQKLDLGHVGVTDAGLEYLKGLSHLEWLNVEGTKVTDAGVTKLQKALPNCRIVHDDEEPHH